MLDRRIAPSFNALRKIHLPDVKETRLNNGRRVFYLEDNKTQVFKIDLNVRAGSWYSQDYAVVPLTLKLLNEGTQSKTAKQLADKFDSYGSFVEFSPGFDHCTISVYGLTKYFSQNLELLSELILSPGFSEQSFQSLKQRESQKVRLNLEKSNYLASVTLRENVFGPEHPYGKRIQPEDIDSLELNTVKSFYESHFGDFDIMLSGNLPEVFKDNLEEYLGSSDYKVSNASRQKTDINHAEKSLAINNPKFVQSSIRIGKRLFNRSHEDYLQFMVLNEILGGYFGSRLMKNIREEKGLTYGIYSQLYALNHEGYFFVGTDVNSENEALTIEEIHKEIEILKSQKVSNEELETVKNYMTGTFAGSISSPFSIMDKFKAVHYQGLNLSFFQDYIEAINSVNSESILSLSNQYLRTDSFTQVVVGQ
ncbi:MAG: insulinase family protein [Roseivirga sp.]|nr:insulinase family protein [Roseivirga sp.]